MSETSKDIEKAQTGPRLEYSSNGGPPQPMRRRMANPAPMGLFSFASTTFVLSMFNVNTRGIHTPNVVVGMSLFGGGLVQLLSGMWEVPNGNVFGATAFSSYGAFWMSYATIFIPASGIIDAYEGRMDEFNNAIGLYLIVWFMMTVMFIMPVMRRNMALTALLSVLAIALLMLAVGAWSGNPMINKAGGVFGIITALGAFYIGVAEMMLAERTAAFRLPLGVWSVD